MRKLAIKRLTASDLTFFEWQFRNHNAGNQKSINLNADVFVERLYPALPQLAFQYAGRLPVDLTISGPGLAPPLNLQRKIVKHGAYKNWRLNGEFIHNPEDDSSRFNELKPNDFCVLDFEGKVVPDRVRIFFIAEAIAEDRPLHTEIAQLMSGQSMMPTTISELEKLIARASPHDEHPLRDLALEEALEDAAQGGSEGVKKLLKRPPGRFVSKETLADSRARAEEIGRLGEELLDQYLAGLKATGEIDNYEWVSDNNAVSPFDFCVEQGGLNSVLDVKSTAGGFERPLHVSFNEIREMCQGGSRYDIFRLYEANLESAKLRICRDLRETAEPILAVLEQLPEGVRATGVTLTPSNLDFGEEQVVQAAAEEDQS